MLLVTGEDHFLKRTSQPIKQRSRRTSHAGDTHVRQHRIVRIQLRLPHVHVQRKTNQHSTAQRSSRTWYARNTCQHRIGRDPTIAVPYPGSRSLVQQVRSARGRVNVYTFRKGKRLLHGCPTFAMHGENESAIRIVYSRVREFACLVAFWGVPPWQVWASHRRGRGRESITIFYLLLYLWSRSFIRSISASRVLISSLRPRLRLICFTANSSPVDSFNPLKTFRLTATRARVCVRYKQRHTGGEVWRNLNLLLCPNKRISFRVLNRKDRQSRQATVRNDPR